MAKGKTAKHRLGKALRVEPPSHDIFDIYPEIGKNSRKARWMPFIRALNGYHTQVAMDFAQSFNGFQAQVGGLTMYVSEGTIAEAFKLDIAGDRWFKKGKVDETLLNQSSLPEFQNLNWGKGIPLSCVLKKWKMILVLVKNYISCEGRYIHIFRFHVNFLLHMIGDTQMNLPFFILKSLQKMSLKVQKFPNSAKSSLAHTCLITALVYHELSCYQIDENIFLVDAGFDLKTELDRQDKKRRSRKKMQNIANPAQESPKPKVTSTYEKRGKKQVNPPETKTDTLGSKHSDTRVEDEESKPKPRVTRARNMFRLNSKALLKPSLKDTAPVNIDSDTPVEPAPKKRVSFRIASKDTLLKLAQAVEAVEMTKERKKHGIVDAAKARFSDGNPKRYKEEHRQRQGKRLAPVHHDGKLRHGKKNKAQ